MKAALRSGLHFFYIRVVILSAAKDLLSLCSTNSSASTNSSLIHQPSSSYILRPNPQRLINPPPCRQSNRTSQQLTQFCINLRARLQNITRLPQSRLTRLHHNRSIHHRIIQLTPRRPDSGNSIHVSIRPKPLPANQRIIHMRHAHYYIRATNRAL